MAFDLVKLLTDVFDPQAGEVVTVACDVPRNDADDSDRWRERRAMAAEWHAAFSALGHGRGFTTNPLLRFTATGANNSDLPSEAVLGDAKVPMEATLLDSTLLVFLTEFSATAPLSVLTERKEDLRAASLPGVEKRMEKSALAADYREVARRCAILDGILKGAERLDVSFSTGHKCTFDLRFRTPEMDDGFLPRFKKGDRVINLPSGETFIVPYEGELPGKSSGTSGTIPVHAGNEVVLFRVSENKIVKVEGASAEARSLRAQLAADPARTNVAEVAFGCNDKAKVTGNVLEDEKAGFHWAYGRSDHLGGTVGPDSFISAEMVVHQDIVYAKGNPIQVAEAVVTRGDAATTVIRNGAYVVF